MTNLTFRDSSYYRDTDFDFSSDDGERSVYTFEEEDDHRVYQGKIYIPESSSGIYDWNFQILRKFQPVGDTKLAMKDLSKPDVIELEETPVWFQELCKPIRLKLLFK